MSSNDDLLGKTLSLKEPVGTVGDPGFLAAGTVGVVVEVDDTGLYESDHAIVRFGGEEHAVDQRHFSYPVAELSTIFEEV